MPKGTKKLFKKKMMRARSTLDWSRSNNISCSQFKPWFFPKFQARLWRRKARYACSTYTRTVAIWRGRRRRTTAVWRLNITSWRCKMSVRASGLRRARSRRTPSAAYRTCSPAPSTASECCVTTPPARAIRSPPMMRYSPEIPGVCSVVCQSEISFFVISQPYCRPPLLFQVLDSLCYCWRIRVRSHLGHRIS